MKTKKLGHPEDDKSKKNIFISSDTVSLNYTALTSLATYFALLRAARKSRDQQPLQLENHVLSYRDIIANAVYPFGLKMRQFFYFHFCSIPG